MEKFLTHGIRERCIKTEWCGKIISTINKQKKKKTSYISRLKYILSHSISILNTQNNYKIIYQNDNILLFFFVCMNINILLLNVFQMLSRYKLLITFETLVNSLFCCYRCEEFWNLKIMHITSNQLFQLSKENTTKKVFKQNIKMYF